MDWTQCSYLQYNRQFCLQWWLGLVGRQLLLNSTKIGLQLLGLPYTQLNSSLAALTLPALLDLIITWQWLLLSNCLASLSRPAFLWWWSVFLPDYLDLTIFLNNYLVTAGLSEHTGHLHQQIFLQHSFVVGYITGAWVGLLLRLSRSQIIGLSLETAMQNSETWPCTTLTDL